MLLASQRLQARSQPTQRKWQLDSLAPQIIEQQPTIAASLHRRQYLWLDLQLDMASVLIAKLECGPAIDALIRAQAQAVRQVNRAKRHINDRDWSAFPLLKAKRNVGDLLAFVGYALENKAHFASLIPGLASFAPIPECPASLANILRFRDAAQANQQRQHQANYEFHADNTFI